MVIRGLQARPELNEKNATVLKWVEDKGRYQVQIEGENKPLGVRPQNLHLPSSSSTQMPPGNPFEDASAVRECRSMFCGEALTFESEEEAVEHMSICPALAEQLSSKAAFTIPKNTLPNTC